MSINFDGGRRNGMVTEQERLNGGSLWINSDTRATVPVEEKSPTYVKHEKEEDEEEREDEVVTQPEQGRTLAQFEHSVTRRSRRQNAQTSLLRRCNGCFSHFQASPSSAKIAMTAMQAPKTTRGRDRKSENREIASVGFAEISASSFDPASGFYRGLSERKGEKGQVNHR